ETPRTVDGNEVTDFCISGAIRNHPDLKGIRSLQIHGSLPASDPSRPYSYIVCGTIEKGKPVVDEGLPAPPALVDYLRELIAIEDKNPVALLRFCFDRLEH